MPKKAAQKKPWMNITQTKWKQLSSHFMINIFDVPFSCHWIEWSSDASPIVFDSRCHRGFDCSRDSNLFPSMKVVAMEKLFCQTWGNETVTFICFWCKLTHCFGVFPSTPVSCFLSDLRLVCRKLLRNNPSAFIFFLSSIQKFASQIFFLMASMARRFKKAKRNKDEWRTMRIVQAHYHSRKSGSSQDFILKRYSWMEIRWKKSNFSERQPGFLFRRNIFLLSSKKHFFSETFSYQI